MPRKITPMKYRGFYCPDELYKKMQDAAISLNESDSEYIRKAVEERNVKLKSTKVLGMEVKIDQNLKGNEFYLSEKKPTIPELKEKEMPEERPTFFKK